MTNLYLYCVSTQKYMLYAVVVAAINRQIDLKTINLKITLIYYLQTYLDKINSWP